MALPWDCHSLCLPFSWVFIAVPIAFHGTTMGSHVNAWTFMNFHGLSWHCHAFSWHRLPCNANEVIITALHENIPWQCHKTSHGTAITVRWHSHVYLMACPWHSHGSAAALSWTWQGHEGPSKPMGVQCRGGSSSPWHYHGSAIKAHCRVIRMPWQLHGSAMALSWQSVTFPSWQCHEGP